MNTFLDTNVLLDIFVEDPGFYRASSQAVRKCLQEGSLHACEIVWAEVAVQFVDSSQFVDVMKTLGVEFSPMNRDAAILAGAIWRAYLQSSSKKRERVAADFLIGAHAMSHGGRLLTRDKGFFREYFKGLEIVVP